LLRLVFLATVKALIRRIPLLVVTFLIGLSIHSFLLVYSNDGFDRWPTLLSDFLSTRGNEIGSMIIWGVGSALVITAVKQAKRVGGSVEYLDRFKHALMWVRESYTSLGETALPLLLSRAMLALGITCFFRNNLIGLIMLGCMVSALWSQSESFWFYFLRIIWNDIQRNPARHYHKRRLSTQVQKPFDTAKACVGTAGAALGFLLGFLWPGIYFFGFTYFVITLILSRFSAMWYSARQKRQQQPATLVSALALALLAILTMTLPVYADDGGWAECGGTWDAWVQSEGSKKAIYRGMWTAASAALAIVIAHPLDKAGREVADTFIAAVGSQEMFVELGYKSHHIMDYAGLLRNMPRNAKGVVFVAETTHRGLEGALTGTARRIVLADIESMAETGLEKRDVRAAWVADPELSPLDTLGYLTEDGRFHSASGQVIALAEEGWRLEEGVYRKT
jgi:hypothetical protein